MNSLSGGNTLNANRGSRNGVPPCPVPLLLGSRRNKPHSEWNVLAPAATARSYSPLSCSNVNVLLPIATCPLLLAFSNKSQYSLALLANVGSDAACRL